MKILRPICAGLDVHKNVIVATLGITDMNTQITQYLQESFSTLNCDLYRLRDWLLDHHCHDVCMESTGKYWIPVFNILEDHLHVFLTHPKYVKATWPWLRLSAIPLEKRPRLSCMRFFPILVRPTMKTVFASSFIVPVKTKI